MSTARDKVIGSTIRNTEVTLRTATGEQQINLVAMLANNQGAAIVPAAELELGQAAAEPQIGPVVVELRLAPVAVEPQIGRAAAELELAPAVVELQIDPVAVELVPNQAAVELERVPAAAEPQIVRAVEELQHAPVVAVPVPGHRRGRLAAALRTKSVTAAHPRDLVPLLEAGEDLAAAVAETMPEPAAAEAATAWAAAE